jgi:hypothetical protein
MYCPSAVNRFDLALSRNLMSRSMIARGVLWNLELLWSSANFLHTYASNLLDR